MSTQTRIPDKDMRSFNQFMEAAGLLTDDEFFGSL